MRSPQPINPFPQQYHRPASGLIVDRCPGSPDQPAISARAAYSAHASDPRVSPREHPRRSRPPRAPANPEVRRFVSRLPCRALAASRPRQLMLLLPSAATCGRVPCTTHHLPRLRQPAASLRPTAAARAPPDAADDLSKIIVDPVHGPSQADLQRGVRETADSSPPDAIFPSAPAGAPGFGRHLRRSPGVAPLTAPPSARRHPTRDHGAPPPAAPVPSDLPKLKCGAPPPRRARRRAPRASPSYAASAACAPPPAAFQIAHSETHSSVASRPDQLLRQRRQLVRQHTMLARQIPQRMQPVLHALQRERIEVEPPRGTAPPRPAHRPAGRRPGRARPAPRSSAPSARSATRFSARRAELRKGSIPSSDTAASASASRSCRPRLSFISRRLAGPAPLPRPSRGPAPRAQPPRRAGSPSSSHCRASAACRAASSRAAASRRRPPGPPAGAMSIPAKSSSSARCPRGLRRPRSSMLAVQLHQPDPRAGAAPPRGTRAAVDPGRLAARRGGDPPQEKLVLLHEESDPGLFQHLPQGGPRAGRKLAVNLALVRTRAARDPPRPRQPRTKPSASSQDRLARAGLSGQHVETRLESRASRSMIRTSRISSDRSMIRRRVGFQPTAPQIHSPRTTWR